MKKCPDVHPEIREFWEKDGFKIESRFFNEDESRESMLWDLCDGGLIVQSIGYTYVNSEAKYFYKNVEYSEAEMLRVIKMKAFL